MNHFDICILLGFLEVISSLLNDYDLFTTLIWRQKGIGHAYCVVYLCEFKYIIGIV